VLTHIAALDCREAEEAHVGSHIQWAEEGKTSTRFFLRPEKKHGIEEWVSSIRLPDRVLRSDMHSICHLWVAFLPTLFMACPTYTTMQEKLLNNVSSPLPSGSGTSCDGWLSVAEVHSALKGAAISKSPGSDRLSVEFYSCFWHIIGKDLVDVLNCSFQ